MSETDEDANSCPPAGARSGVKSADLAHIGEVWTGLRDAGAEWADSPAEVARRADLVLTVLFDEQAVRDTYLGPAGLLGEPGVCKDLEAVLATAIDAGAAAPVADALTIFTRIAAAGFVDRDLISVVAHAARQSEPAGPAS